MRTALYAVLAASFLATPAVADVFHLEDGQAIEGALIGRSPEGLSVLTRGGEVLIATSTLQRVEPQDVERRVERRVEGARRRFLRTAKREVVKLLRDYRRAGDDMGVRLAVEEQLSAWDSGALIEPLGEALSGSDAMSRALALRMLGAMESRGAVDALLRCSMTSPDEAFAGHAHEAAYALDGTRTRLVYEGVAISQTRPERRIRAIRRLEGMGEDASIPALIRVVEHVYMEIRVSMGTLKNLRSVPLNLGTAGGAAITAPVELPEMQLTEINTTMIVPVETLRAIRSEALGALKGISGQDHGEDAERWADWYREQR